MPTAPHKNQMKTPKMHYLYAIGHVCTHKHHICMVQYYHEHKKKTEIISIFPLEIFVAYLDSTFLIRQFCHPYKTWSFKYTLLE